MHAFIPNLANSIYPIHELHGFLATLVEGTLPTSSKTEGGATFFQLERVGEYRPPHFELNVSSRRQSINQSVDFVPEKIDPILIDGGMWVSPQDIKK